jgi:hypothetical protein
MQVMVDVACIKFTDVAYIIKFMDVAHINGTQAPTHPTHGHDKRITPKHAWPGLGCPCSGGADQALCQDKSEGHGRQIFTLKHKLFIVGTTKAFTICEHG